jgi:hypothetical protein
VHLEPRATGYDCSVLSDRLAIEGGPVPLGHRRKK